MKGKWVYLVPVGTMLAGSKLKQTPVLIMALTSQLLLGGKVLHPTEILCSHNYANWQCYFEVLLKVVIFGSTQAFFFFVLLFILQYSR